MQNENLQQLFKPKDSRFQLVMLKMEPRAILNDKLYKGSDITGRVFKGMDGRMEKHGLIERKPFRTHIRKNTGVQ